MDELIESAAAKAATMATDDATRGTADDATWATRDGALVALMAAISDATWATRDAISDATGVAANG